MKKTSIFSVTFLYVSPSTKKTKERTYFLDWDSKSLFKASRNGRCFSSESRFVGLKQNHLSNKKNWVGSFQSGIIFLYPVTSMWEVMRCHEKMIPSLNNQYFTESKVGFLFHGSSGEVGTNEPVDPAMVGEIPPTVSPL